MIADRTEALADITAWQQAGWIRPLDLVLARFIDQQLTETDAALPLGLLLVSVALVSHQLGRGHNCLPLAQILANPQAELALPPHQRAALDLPLHRRLPAHWLAHLQPAAWAAALRRCPQVIADAQAGNPWQSPQGNTPLVLDLGRLYLRRYWQFETQVASAIHQRLHIDPLDAAQLRPLLDARFQPWRAPDEQAGGTPHWQTLAAALAARSPFTVISGGPGTGKTTTVVQLLALLQSLTQNSQAPKAALRIQLAAPTGKAAARLSESIGKAVAALSADLQALIPSRVTTLHQLLGVQAGVGRPRHHADNPLHLDLLVVDEASMIDLEMMANLLAALPAQARIILLGDKDQLASVEAGAVLAELCQTEPCQSQPDNENPASAHCDYSTATCQWLAQATGYALSNPGRQQHTALADHRALLRKSHRFSSDSGIGALARAVNSGNSQQARQIWAQGYADLQQITLSAQNHAAFNRLIFDPAPNPTTATPAAANPAHYGRYLQVIQQQRPSTTDADSLHHWARQVLQAFASFQLLAVGREGPWGVAGLNDAAAHWLQQNRLIEQTTGWYEGRPLLITRNNYRLGLMNGDVGITLRDSTLNHTLRVFFELSDGQIQGFSPSRLSEVETAYAMTVHKSQGSEFNHAALILPDSDSPLLSRELIYTAITRAKACFTLACANPNLFQRAIERRVLRASALHERLI